MNDGIKGVDPIKVLATRYFGIETASEKMAEQTSEFVQDTTQNNEATTEPSRVDTVTLSLDALKKLESDKKAAALEAAEKEIVGAYYDGVRDR